MRRRYPVLLCSLLLLLLAGHAAPALEGRAPASIEDDFLILLTNDDGYDAAGLRAMVEAFAPVARVVVAAPAEQQSGVGSAITYREPIFVRKVSLFGEVEAYSVTAYPATCARIGIESLAPRKPDLVISGINSSANLGGSVILSGTVGAARQAAMAGVPAMAVSRGRGADYGNVAKVALDLVQRLRREGRIAPGLLLNVNVPAGPFRGFRVVRQSVAVDTENYEKRVNPRGFVYYWSNWTPAEDRDPGTDIGAFAQGFTTVTPLRVDQTDTAAMDGFRGLAQSPAAAREDSEPAVQLTRGN